MDKLYYNVLEFIVKEQKVSIASIQRQFKIGFARAVKLVEEYSEQGYIKGEECNYEICISLEDLDNLQLDNN